MKSQAGSAKFSGEERIHSDGGGILKKLLERTKAPKIIDADAIKKTQKAVASEARTEFNVILNQVFGVELKAGKSHSLAQKSDEYAHLQEKAAEAPKMSQEFIEQFSEFKRQAEGKKGSSDQSAIEQQLDMILAELRNLKNSSDELENVFKDVAIDTVPEKPGIYHLTFFEGFLKLVIKMRDKVEDGVVFAKLFKSRKQEKSYSSMAKKGGTSFTMHHDRSVATQTG